MNDIPKILSQWLVRSASVVDSICSILQHIIRKNYPGKYSSWLWKASPFGLRYRDFISDGRGVVNEILKDQSNCYFLACPVSAREWKGSVSVKDTPGTWFIYIWQLKLQSKVSRGMWNTLEGILVTAISMLSAILAEYGSITERGSIRCCCSPSLEALTPFLKSNQSAEQGSFIM
jgi:hypothetical protein